MVTKPKTAKPAPRAAVPLTVVAVGSVKKPRANQKTPAELAVIEPGHHKGLASDAASKVQSKANTVGVTLTKKDLIEQIVATTGAKMNQVRDVVEATLTILGNALTNGATLNLPPLGKAKVSRPSDDTGRAMTVKVRRTTGNGGSDGKAKQSLADVED